MLFQIRAPKRPASHTRLRVALNVVLAVNFALFISVANATAEPINKIGIDKNPATAAVAAKPSGKPDAKPSTSVVSKPSKPSKPARPDKPDNNVATPDIEVANASPNVTICHQNNGSGSGWWVAQSVSTNSAHYGNLPAHAYDIIPGVRNMGNFTRVITISGSPVTINVNGAAIIANNCDYTPPVDQCSNVTGFQVSVPSGYTQSLSNKKLICTQNPRSQIVGETTLVCAPTYILTFVIGYTKKSANYGDVFNAGGYDGDSKAIIAPFNYYNSSRVLAHYAGKGDQAFLANNCSSTPPTDTDVCENIEGTQTAPPSPTVQHGVNCNPPALTCDFDETALDNGSASNSSPNDGWTDECEPNPAECDFDEVGVDTNENQIIDSCAPKTLTCGSDQTPVDTNENGIPDACVDIECEAGQVLDDSECSDIGSCPEGSTFHDSNENQIVDAGECSTTTGCGVTIVTNPSQFTPRSIVRITEGSNQEEETPAAVTCVDCPDGTSRTVDTNGDGKIDVADCAPKVVTPVTPITPEAPAAPITPETLPLPTSTVCPIAGTLPVATSFGGTACVEDHCPAIAGAQENEDTCPPATADLGGDASNVGGASQAGGGVAGTAADVVAGDDTLPLTGLGLGLLLIIGFGALGGGSSLKAGARRLERTEGDAA